ncbi:major facilitator superfamily domain-containing protein [Mycena metata]|uniref:Major facilitator superfamily domain-containing protein n=1 Tax=Mycena metata TaxID=1033252 RepID=A0AAD7N9W9_9AGAR|nr:major facilitator superfamily domain-containing protein [Mycena metata]
MVQQLSLAKKCALLALFCLAQFLDVFNGSALYATIPTLRKDLGYSETGATWLISAYQLTFASFLLSAGKISDVYDPKIVFVGGVAIQGLLGLGAGFVNTRIPLIVLRALNGVAAAQTIPSALSLIINVFPEQDEQAFALGAFGGTGAIANSRYPLYSSYRFNANIVLGLVIGAIFVQFASWHWAFWFSALVSLPVAAMSTWLVPPQVLTADRNQPPREKIRRLDILGVSVLTTALILLIFAITSGSSAGWKSAGVVAPLVISVLMVGGFFLYETRIPEQYAAIPPRTWFLPNFAVLFAAALMPYFYWTTVSTLYTILWQNIYGISAIKTAVYMVPLGVVSFATSFSGRLTQWIHPKWLILGGQFLALGSTVMFVFADTWSKYWPLVFPAFCIGSTGAMLAFVHTNLAIFRTTPQSMSGTVGALFNGALQLGSALGLAVATSIETSVEAHSPSGAEGFRGRRAAWLFLAAVIATEAICVAIFFRTLTPKLTDTETSASSEKSSNAAVGEVQ